MTKLASIVFLMNLFACAQDPQPDPIMPCGNGTCEAGETPATCPADCKPKCGDGTCDATAGETVTTCAADCHDTCGDMVCGATETSTSCAMDCAAQFKVSNNSTSTLNAVYAWACGTSNTYANLLNGTMPPGYYLEFDTVNPGCWNFEIYTTTNQTASDSNVQLKERVLTTWTIN